MSERDETTNQDTPNSRQEGGSHGSESEAPQNTPPDFTAMSDEEFARHMARQRGARPPSEEASEPAEISEAKEDADFDRWIRQIQRQERREQREEAARESSRQEGEELRGGRESGHTVERSGTTPEPPPMDGDITRTETPPDYSEDLQRQITRHIRRVEEELPIPADGTVEHIRPFPVSVFSAEPPPNATAADHAQKEYEQIESELSAIEAEREASNLPYFIWDAKYPGKAARRWELIKKKDVLGPGRTWRISQFESDRAQLEATIQTLEDRRRESHLPDWFWDWKEGNPILFYGELLGNKEVIVELYEKTKAEEGLEVAEAKVNAFLYEQSVGVYIEGAKKLMEMGVGQGFSQFLSLVGRFIAGFFGAFFKWLASTRIISAISNGLSRVGNVVSTAVGKVGNAIANTKVGKIVSRIYNWIRGALGYNTQTIHDYVAKQAQREATRAAQSAPGAGATATTPATQRTIASRPITPKIEDLGAENTLPGATRGPSLNSKGPVLQLQSRGCGLATVQAMVRDALRKYVKDAELIRLGWKPGWYTAGGITREGVRVLGTRPEGLKAFVEHFGAKAELVRDAKLIGLAQHLAKGKQVAVVINCAKAGQAPMYHWVRLEGFLIDKQGRVFVSYGDPWNGNSWRVLGDVFETRMQGPWQAVVAEWPKRLNPVAAALPAAPGTVGAAPFVVGGAIGAITLGTFLFFPSAQGGDGNQVAVGEGRPTVQEQGPVAMDAPAQQAPPPCTVGLTFESYEAIAGQAFPYQGVFIVQSFDPQGMLLPGVTVTLEAIKENADDTTLTTNTGESGSFRLGVRAPAGTHEQKITSARWGDYECAIQDDAKSYIWNIPAPAPPLAVPHPVPAAAPKLVKAGQTLGVKHRVGDSDLLNFWYVQHVDGAPATGATVEVNVQGSGVLQNKGSGVTDARGLTLIPILINQYGPKTVTLNKIIGPDGSVFEQDPGSLLTLTYNVGPANVDPIMPAYCGGCTPIM